MNHEPVARRALGRGPDAQALRREMERRLRMRVVALVRWGRRCGFEREEAAWRLGVPAWLLRAWEEAWREDRLRARPRGRPVQRVDGATKELVLGLFDLTGPEVGVRTVAKFFPGAARAELAGMLREYRETYVSENTRVVHELRWTNPGRVWAMDYTQPPSPVDGKYRQILSVRDLGSGYQPRALPLTGKSARGTAAALESAFREHGAPLVLKSDNDGTLVGAKVQGVLARWGVLALLSPPGYPKYNGAAEAGIGGLKTRAEHQAARHGRSGEWSCDDVEAARLQANELARPRGRTGPTPEEAWVRRRAIALEERARLRETVAGLREEELREYSTLFGSAVPVRKDRIARAAAERNAMARALVALGYLKVRRRRIPPPISRRIRRKIR